MLDRATFNHSVGLTARTTAAARANESMREDRLFNDPWARLLAGEQGLEAIKGSEDGGASIIVRTRFFDDFLQGLSNQHSIRQFVLVAAGLDTRAFRFNWPERTRLFELDQLPVLEYKEQILQSVSIQPACERKALSVDLTADWKQTLLDAGFDPKQPTGWLIEGLFFYLPHESVAHIMKEVTGLAAPGSWVGFDVYNSIWLTSPLTRSRIERMEKRGAPWIGSMDDPEGFLDALGWNAIKHVCGEGGVNYGRRIHPFLPVSTPEDPCYWFVTAQKETPAR